MAYPRILVPFPVPVVAQLLGKYGYRTRIHGYMGTWVPAFLYLFLSSSTLVFQPHLSLSVSTISTSTSLHFNFTSLNPFSIGRSEGKKKKKKTSQVKMR